MNTTVKLTLFATLLLASLAAVHAADAPALTPQPFVLKAESFRHYIEDFNKNDNELYKNVFSNAVAWDFLKVNIPLLDCPDEEIQKTYYFRWWTYRKHIKQTPAGFIVDEFMPDVYWAGKYNSINCAAGHHIREGRWLADPKYINDYTAFWFGGGGNPRLYSFWAADSVWQRTCVSGDPAEALRLLPDLIKNYQEWEKTKLSVNGLYEQSADRDGMEKAIGGDGYRPTINSYQYGDALAIARIADMAGKPDVAKDYRAKAAKLKELVQTKLWNQDQQFFEVARGPKGFALCKWVINDDLELTKSTKATSSAGGPVQNLNDVSIMPKDVWDAKPTKYDFNGHYGTTEWIQYNLATPTQVSSFTFYLRPWYTSPEKFRVLYRQNGEWKDATDVQGGFPPVPGAVMLCKIAFAPVQADAVKLEVDLFGTDRFKMNLADVREQLGYTPWYFNMPDPQFNVAWKQAMDPKGFFAPMGLTTAEQRHPHFGRSCAGCSWNGPSWPFSTSATLTALANLLNGAPQDVIGAKDYFQLLQIYAKAQRLKLDDDRVVPWIDEAQNSENGDWCTRTSLIRKNEKPVERGKDYNHSTYCDLVINGLIGLRPRSDETVEVNPLVPEGTWDYFCIDQIRYHGHWLIILFDKDGKRYGRGKGLRVFADGKEIASSITIRRVTGKL